MSEQPAILDRYYQRDAIRDILGGWRQFDSGVLSLTTGAGKTYVAARVIKELVGQGKRCLFLGDQDELCIQPLKSLQRFAGIIAAVEKGKDRASLNAKTVVGSAQTFIRKARRERFPKDHFDYIVSDECHRGTSRGAEICEYFEGAKVLGMTATPFRAGLQNLSRWFQTVFYDKPMSSMPGKKNPGMIDEGFAPAIKQVTLPIEIDLEQVKTSITPEGKDYAPEDCSAAIEPYYEAIAKIIADRFKRRHIICYLPLIKSSMAFASILRRHGVTALHVDGSSPDREEIIERFSRGEFCCLCNAGVCCLDDQTEILTTRGFLTINQLTSRDEVANWNMDGTVYFARPTEVVQRKTRESEQIVSVETIRNNLRITEDHDMIVNAGGGGKRWKKIKAINLREGHKMPAFGVAAPLPVVTAQPEQLNAKQIALRVTGAAYAIRKRTGVGRKESREIAKRRTETRAKLQYKQPPELTLEECWIIGMWLADGNLSVSKEGTRTYSIAQSTAYPTIVEKIEENLKIANITNCRQRTENGGTTKPSYSWVLPLENWGDRISENGIFRLIPYLKKHGTRLFWGLDEHQFDSLLWGFWAGDGEHGKPTDFKPKYVRASGTKRSILNLFCEIGSVRGWKCNIQPCSMNKNSPAHYLPQWRISMVKGRHRYLSFRSEIKRKNAINETVWCVTTTSGNIITRRGGQVTVMGNSTGVDIPIADAMLNLQPMHSPALYQQRAGRVARVLPGVVDDLPEQNQSAERKERIAWSDKPVFEIFDVLWQHDRLGVMRPESLVCDNPEDAQRMFERRKRDMTAEDLQELHKRVQEDKEYQLIQAIERAAMKTDSRKGVAANEAGVIFGNARLSDYVPVARWEMDKPSDAQLIALCKFGLDVATVKSKGHAKALMDEMVFRATNHMATTKQLRFIYRINAERAPEDKIPHPERLDFTEASAAIEAYIGRKHAAKLEQEFARV